MGGMLQALMMTLSVRSTSFDPTSIAGCNMWCEADKLSLTNGTAVSSWTDFSGTNNTPVQATGSLQPIYTTGAINGLPAIAFDGVDDYMVYPTNIGLSCSVFVVCQLTLVGSSQGSYAALIIDGGLNGCRICAKISNNDWGSFAGANVDSGELLSASTTYLLELLGNISGTTIYRSGVQKATSGNAPSGANDVAQIGRERNVGGRAYKGYIACIIGYNTQLSSTNRAIVETALINKYAIP